MTTSFIISPFLLLCKS